MSNDNDPRDDAMREIEAALVQLFYDAAGMCVSPDVFTGTLALIRSKLPQPTSAQPSPKVGISPAVLGSVAEKLERNSALDMASRHAEEMTKDLNERREAWLREQAMLRGMTPEQLAEKYQLEVSAPFWKFDDRQGLILGESLRLVPR